MVSSKSGYESSFSSLRTEKVCAFTLGKRSKRPGWRCRAGRLLDLSGGGWGLEDGG